MKKRAIIAMSGGVDSSVAAALLQKDGYDVLGVTMEIFDGSTHNSEGNHHACFGPGEAQDVEDAAKVAKQLGIPYRTVDLKREYKRNILDFFVKEYQQGNTPNPCVKCNHEMKFSAIGNELANLGIEYDYFATGHYARVETNHTFNRKVLKKAKDLHKDQTYFLSSLTTDLLQKSLFPLGNMEKQQVRQLAREIGLDVSDKTESQDFVAGGYHQLFDSGITPGPITTKMGKVIGQHKGIEYFTVGQRKGLGISSTEPLYVTAKDPETNTLIVGPKKELYGTTLIVGKINWHLWDDLHDPMQLKTKIRFRHEEAESLVTPLENGDVRVEFTEPQSSIAPGQTAVFYDGDMVVGGGIIMREIS